MQLYVIQEILSFPYVLHGLVGKYIFACLDVISVLRYIVIPLGIAADPDDFRGKWV